MPLSAFFSGRQTLPFFPNLFSHVAVPDARDPVHLCWMAPDVIHPPICWFSNQQSGGPPTNQLVQPSTTPLCLSLPVFLQCCMRTATAFTRDGNSGSGFRSPAGFRPKRCGCRCNFAPVGSPTPNPNKIGFGRGFHFSPTGWPDT
jgi:hypothetical protein